MKLEPKYIAPYYPHKLRLFFTDEEQCELVGIELGRLLIISDNGNYGSCGYEDAKLLLRQLSQLTEEITIGDKTFVPMKYFYEILGGGFSSYKGFLKCNLIDFKQPLTGLRYDIISKLFEWHFDIYNLIENNLAVEITTNKL